MGRECQLLASGKTLTLTGANTLTAANGIFIKGGTIAVANEGTLSGTINVQGDAGITVSGNADSAGTMTIDVASGETLTLTASSLTATDTINVTGGGTVTPSAAIAAKVNIAEESTVKANSEGSIYVANFAGSGTIVFDGVRPSTAENDATTASATSEEWSGILWVKNYLGSLNEANKLLYPQYWGNSGSKIKWTNVNGQFRDNMTLESEWVLDNGAASHAIRRVGGYTSNNKLIIPKISGTGTFKEGNGSAQIFCFLDISGFTGTIQRENADCTAKISLGTSDYIANSGEVLVYDCACQAKITGPMSVKTYGGTVTFSGANDNTGDMKVLSGATAKAGSEGTAGDNGNGPFGPKVVATSVASTTRRVEVEDGGTIDMNGKPEMRYFFKLAGDGVDGNGALINTQADVSSGKANVSGIELAADASIGGSTSFGIIAGNYNTTVFDFAGYTLSKKGANTVYVVNGAKKADSTKGAIKVEAGYIHIYDGGAGKTTDLGDTLVEVAGGTLIVEGAFNFGGLNQTDGTINIYAGKTASATDTTVTSISLATLAGTGTLNLSGCTAATTLNINAGAARDKSSWFGGTINYPSNLATVNITLDEADGEVASSSINFDQASYSFGEGVTVDYQVLMKSGALVSGTYEDGTIRYTEPVARIGTTGYDTLAGAISAAAENDTVVLLGESSENITLNKTINFVETGTFSGTFTGSGKIILPQGVVAFKSGSTSMWPEGWTGSVEIPAFTATANTAISFNNLGNEASTVVLKGINYAYEVYPSDSIVNPTICIDGTVHFCRDDSGNTTQFRCISGDGNLRFYRYYYRSVKTWRIETLKSFTGTIGALYADESGQISDIKVEIGTVACEAGLTPSIGDKIVNWTSESYYQNIVNVSGTAVTIGGETTGYKLEKKSGGLYVAAVASATPTGGSATEYATLSAAKTALGSNAGTITLLMPSAENISLAIGQVLDTNGNSYTGTVSPTGDYIEVASASGIYRAVDNSSNTWQGSSGGDWGTAANWGKGVVPNTYTAVTLPANDGTAYSIGVTSSDQCGSITVNGDVTLNRGTSDWQQLHINGNVSGSGTLTLNMVGLRADSGSGITVSCDFIGDGGTDNAFVGGKPFTFENPVVIKGSSGSFFKNESVVITFNDSVEIQENAKLNANGANIVFCNSDIRLPSGGYLQPTSGAMTITDDAITWPSAINISGFAIDAVSGIVGSLLVEDTTINAVGDVQIGTGSTGSLTIGDGGVFRVGSSSGHKWLTFKTGSGNSEGNFITINEGGELEACVITFNDNSSPCPYAINFNGGKLKTYCGTDYYRELIHDTGIQVNVLAGGAKVEVPATYTATINPVMASGAVADGGLTKLGAGALVLTSSPTYNGKTKVVGGALYLPDGYVPNLHVSTQETTSDKAGYKKYVFVQAASFGGESYDTVAAAIDAAGTAGGGTVTLLRACDEDVTLVDGVYFNDGGFSYTGIINAAASVTWNDDSVTYYTSLGEAASAAVENYKYVTILANTSFVPVDGVKYKIADGVIATLVPYSPEYGAPVASEPDANGAVTYNLKAVNNPTTYTWVGGAINLWSRIVNWQNSLSETADRLPSEDDDVVINIDTSSNPITIPAVTSVKAMSIGNTVKISASNTEKTLTATDGVVLTTETSTLTISGTLTLSGTVTTTVADKCVKWVYGESSKTYSVADPVAEIGDTQYGSLANAIEVATDAGLASITVTDSTAEVPDGYYLINDDAGIAKYQAATVDSSGNVLAYFTSLQNAVDALVTIPVPDYYASYDHFEVYYGTGVSLSVSPSVWSSVKIKCLDGSSVTVSSSSADCEFIGGNPDVNNVVTYAKEDKATTYVWVSATGSQWANLGKWHIGTSDGATASRAPSINDSIILNDGATVLVGANNITVASIVINGVARITGNNGSVTSSSTIDLATASASLAYANITISPVPTTSVSGKAVRVGTIEDEPAYMVVSAGAMIGDVGYETLGDAITAASNGDTITLAADCNTANINLGGKSITFSEGSYTFTGSFTGNGTVVLGSPLKSADPERWAAGWTGIVELKDITTVITDFDFADYGNANSTVRANDVLVRMNTETSGEYGAVKEINIASGGLKFDKDVAINEKTFTFAAKLTGTGSLRIGTPGGDGSHATKANVTKYVFKGDLSEFTGAVDYNDLASYRAAIVFADADDEIPTPTDWGQIIVTDDVTLKSSGTLNGAGGFIVKGTIELLSGGSISTGGDKICGDGTIVLTEGSSTALGSSKFGTEDGKKWTGTVWLKNLSNFTIVPANYGNADSVIKFTGVSGQIAAGTICSPAVELEDDGDTKALTLNSYSITTASTITFNEFRGSGTFATVGGTADAYPRTNFRILKWDDFVGSLDVDRGRAIFGEDTISTDDWRYIYISADADVTIAAGKAFTAAEGLRVYGELTVESNNALSSKAIQGSGTIIYEVAPNNGTTKPSFHATLWTGVVEFQEFAAAGIKLAEYGTSNSKIKINGITSGHLMWENQDVQAEVVLAGAMNITATSHRNYTYAHISGTGSFSVSNSNASNADPNALTITRLDVAAGSVGMSVTNNTSTTLNITTLALPEGASVAVGTKLLTIGGSGTINVSNVTVNGVATPLRWVRKTVDGVDGFYVISGTIFSVW